MSLGGWSITQELLDAMLQEVPTGTLLELGSGFGTGVLSEHYQVYSVEHDEKWTGVFDTNYIFAPIVRSWYDISILSRELPESYDLILVDGPTGAIGRRGFADNLNLFRDDVPIFFDDLERPAEMSLALEVSQKLGGGLIVSKLGEKSFGVVK